VTFPRIKRGWGVTLTTQPHEKPRSRISRSYTSSSTWLQHGGKRDSFTLLFYIYTLQSAIKYDVTVVHIDEMKLYLSNVASNWPIVIGYPRIPEDICARRATVE
jgi:hypothetical protein